MAETTRTLDLSHVLSPERDVLKLPTGDYEIRHPDELSIESHVRVEKAIHGIYKLAQAEETPDLPEPLEREIRAAVRSVVVDLPEDIEAALSPRHRVMILHFFGIRAGQRMEAARAHANGRPSRSASPSRASSASTAGPRKRGSEHRKAS